MSDLIWTTHAAQRALQHDIDPTEVLSIAEDALKAGFAKGGPSRVQRGGTVVVMDGPVLVTVFRRRRAVPPQRCLRGRKVRRRK
jgi:hypothetical protein